MAQTIDPALLEPPDDATVAKALQDFAAAVRHHYGERLRGLYLFGSRARGDHTPESDADVAAVLADDGWTAWIERRVLNRLAYEPSLESGLAIQAWPFSAQAWETDSERSTLLIKSARDDALPLT